MFRQPAEPIVARGASTEYLANCSPGSDLIPQEIIRKKRDGLELSAMEIRGFVGEITSGSVTDEQIAALAMAVWFNGMSTVEQSWLTLAIRDSGHTLAWHDLNGPVLDKHSTGGVGDMVSFAVAPIVAACGGFVPMISGRALGHSGGTLDKLESFPGIDVQPEIATLQRWVRERGLAIVGQTAELAPADRRIYAVRDATSTVESVPLIISSILGKKLCEGLDALVMDVKVGNGAFMRNAELGLTLAEEICEVAESAGLPCTALLTDMNQPLSRSAGNALEMREVIDYLAGTYRHPRFHEVVLAVASDMLVLGGLEADAKKAESRVGQALDSGAAAEKFEAMVAGQGGPRDSLENLARLLPDAAISRAISPAEGGFVHGIDTRALGLAVVVLGGGRQHSADSIDHSVGLSDLAAVGEEVGPDRPVAVIHARSEAEFDEACERVRNAYLIGENSLATEHPVVLGRHTRALPESQDS